MKTAFTVSATIIVENARKDIQYISIQEDYARLFLIMESLTAFSLVMDIVIFVKKVITGIIVLIYAISTIKMLLAESMGVSFAYNIMYVLLVHKDFANLHQANKAEDY